MRTRRRPLGVTVVGRVLAVGGVAGLLASFWPLAPSELVVRVGEEIGLPTGSGLGFTAAAGCLWIACGIGVLRGARVARLAYLVGSPLLTATYWLAEGFVASTAVFELFYLAPLWILTRPQASAYFHGRPPVDDRPRREPRPKDARAVAAMALLATGSLMMLGTTHAGSAIVYTLSRLGAPWGALVVAGGLIACFISGALALVAWGARLWAPARTRMAVGITVVATGLAALVTYAAMTSRAGGITREIMQGRMPLPDGMEPFPSLERALLVLAAMCIPAGMGLVLWQTKLDKGAKP